MIKRDLHLFLRCLIPAAVFTAVLAVVCAAAAAASAQGAERVYTPVKAAVVDGEDSLLSRMLIRGVAEVDYIRELLEIEICDGEEAMEGLASGEFAAVIELPENFIGDILSGEEERGRITLSPAAAMNRDILDGVTSFGELLLASGQYAAFGAVTVIDRYVPDGEIGDELLEKVNSALLSEAMGADSRYFVLTVTDYAGTGVSLAAHYAISWLAAILALSTVMFERLYVSDRDRSMLLRLSGAGVTDGKFLLWKLLLPFAFLFVILLAGAGILSRWIGAEWSALSILSAAAAAAIPTMTAATLLLCVDKGAPAVMLLSVLSLFLCGGIVPRQMLSPWVLALGDLTPLGVSRGLIAPMFGGGVTMLTMGAAVFWAVVALSAMLLQLRRLRLKGGAQ